MVRSGLNSGQQSHLLQGAGFTSSQRVFSSGLQKKDEMAAIKELRARTGAPVKDVKAALESAEWQIGETCSGIVSIVVERVYCRTMRTCNDGCMYFALNPPAAQERP